MTKRSVVARASVIARRAAERLGTTIKAAHQALGRRRGVRLDDVRRRLELLVTAVYDRSIPITVVDPPKRHRWSSWLGVFGARNPMHVAPLPTTDGERIQLPREILGDDPDSLLAEYRLMAIEQAERIVRGTAALVPNATTPVERDLYLVRESAAVDASIARVVPGLRATLASARARALAERPSMSAMSRQERFVETVVRHTLGLDVASDDARRERVAPTSPDESIVWARETVEREALDVGRYRGVAPVPAWGTVKPRPSGASTPLTRADDLATFQGTKYGLGRFGHGSGKGGKQSSDAGEEEGTSELRREGTAVPSPEGPRRVSSPGGGDASAADAEAGNSIEQRAEHDDGPEREDIATTDRRAAASRAPTRAGSRVPAPKPTSSGVEYPEWDWESGDYRETGATVCSHEPAITTDTWGNTVLARYGPLVRRLRERFERLRARRMKLSQQRDGDELDLSAVVRAIVDQRTGHVVDDRLYIAVRPARRGLAIALLIDISGSTDEWVDAGRRVIDVEKVALLLASEALDALGDLYAVLTFSGKGRANVRMRTIKGFDESNGSLVRQRIAALEPEGYTRAGAAIRHTAALLERQPAAHRLLLMISDGKPNDVDGYEGLSGVEDTRQAINEARAAGVYPFCLTIDRQGQEYLGRIFGEAGHTILRNPQQLPMALVKVVKHLLAS